MRKNWKGAAAVFAALATIALLLAACSGGAAPSTSSSASSSTTAEKGPIRVGSKIDVEGPVLGQIILQTLAANGFKVEDLTRTGATKVVRQALIDGQIDVYPEYTANAVLVFHGQNLTDHAAARMLWASRYAGDEWLVIVRSGVAVEAMASQMTTSLWPSSKVAKGRAAV